MSPPSDEEEGQFIMLLVSSTKQIHAVVITAVVLAAVKTVVADPSID